MTKTENVDQPMIPMVDHYKFLNGRKYKCVQPDCDGAHHWYCSCGH